jgi:hypothetical protein
MAGWGYWQEDRLEGGWWCGIESSNRLKSRDLPVWYLLLCKFTARLRWRDVSVYWWQFNILRLAQMGVLAYSGHQ